MMRNNYLIRSGMKMLALALLGMFSSLRGYGQITGYTFTNTAGTYTAISGGTSVGNSGLAHAIFGADPINPISDAGALTASYFGTAGFGAPIGFDFKFGARTYSTFQMSTDGYIKLGGIIPADAYSTIITGSSLPFQFSGSAEDGRDLISAFGASTTGGLAGQTGSTMKYITTGTSPNRVCTIEWGGQRRNAVVGDNLNFQIKLYEGSNKFETVYGPMTTSAASTIAASAGAIGRGPTDFKKVGNTLTATTMDAPVVATTNVVSPFTNERVQYRNGFTPASGRTYTFDPAGSVTCFMPVKPVFTVNGPQVDISWTSSGAASYNVEFRNVTTSGTFAAAPGGTGITGTSLSVTGLTAANVYEFRVQSSCSGADWITASRTIPGPGEICSLAIPFGSVAANAGACTPVTVTAGLGNDGTPTISCGGTSVLTDKWYSFVAPSNGKKIVIETSANGASNPDWAIEVYSSCGGSAIGCFDDFSASDFRPVGELCQFDYTAGQTYYVRLMQMAFYGSGPTINLCIYEDVACPVVPVNNQCAAASVFALQAYGDCPASQVQFTTENATASTGLANPTCNGASAPLDVWVTFNSGTNTAVQMNYTLGTATGVLAQIYSGTCAGLAPVASTCFTAAGNYAITGLTASTNYYIRFWSINNTTWGTFNVCLNEPPTCPSGLGAGFVDIGDIGAGYSSGSRTTCGKDNDIVGGLLNNACGSNNYLTAEDEVFKFTVPSTGLYQVVLASNSSWIGMKIFANCPLLGQGGACVANVGSSTASKNISNITLTAGIEYYLVVDQFAPPTCIGAYEFSIAPNPAPPANDNCGVAAITLTQASTCNYTTFSYSAGATTSTEPGSCAANDDDVWYKFVAATTDPEITVSPSPGYYPVVELFTACGTTSICCQFNGAGAGLPVKLNAPIALTIGATYYIRVYHAFAGSPLTDDFDICIANSPGEATCVDVTGFTTETEACGTFTNTAPAFQAIAIDQTIAGKGYAECGFRDFDYYKITTTQAGFLTFTMNSEFPVLGRIFADAAGSPGTVISTANSTAECSGNIGISFPTSRPAGTYWFLAAPQNFEDVGCASTRNDYLITASFSVNPPLPAANDNCGTPVTLIPCGPSVNSTTLSASQSYPAVTCAGFASDYAFDLFYKFTANTSLHTITATGNQDGVLQAYLGYCNGPNLACADATGAGGVESITLNTVVGQTYYIRWYVYTEGSQPVPANVSIRVTTPGGWSGLTSNDWAVGSNWCEGTVPGVGTNVTIPNVVPAPTVVTTANCNNITLLPGATVVTNSNPLTVRGSMAGNGNILTGTNPVIFTNNLSSQSILGNVTFTNVRNSNTNPGGLIVSSGTSRIAGVMTADANTKLFVNAPGKLIVNSSASGDGSIGVVGTGATITGNVTVERYLPFTSTPGWHFFGPTTGGNTFSGWSDDFEIRAAAPLGGTEGVVFTAGNQHATVFQYNEAEHNVKLDTVQKDGWRIPTGASLTSGKGFRVFLSPSILANNTDDRFENTGTVVLGNAVGGYSFPALTRNEYAPTSDPTISNPSNRGWNLISNPFPSAINWDAAGWTKPSELNNAFFIYNGVLGGYRTYVGSGGISLGVAASANTNPNLIPTGQAFFVKLTTPGNYNATLKASESVKSSGAASFVRTATASNNLRLRISKVGNTTGYEFDAMVRFMDGATESFDQNMDAHFMRGTYESVAFKAGDEDMILSSLPSLDGYRVVPVRSFYSGQTGQFKFNFLELSTFPANVHVYLKDRVLNSIVDVRQYPSYTFTVATTNNLNSNDRFELVFSPTAITDVKPTINGSAVFSLYPNPSNGNKVVASMIGFENESNVAVTITDVLGKVVYSATQTIGSGNSAEHAISAKLAAGVYNVSCIGKSHKFTTKLVVE